MFITESGLSEQVQFVALDSDAEAHVQDRSDRTAKVGQAPAFPLVEVEPGIYRSDSDVLIAYFAEQYGVDPAATLTLQFYRTGLFATF